MASTPARSPRTVLTIAVVLLVASALVAVASPAEAAHRPTPRALRTTAADQTSLSVWWHRVRKAPGYRVRWSVRRSMAGSHRLSTTRHRAVIGGLSPDTRYYVQVAVAARKGHGRRLSQWSKVLVRRTPPIPCPTTGDLGDPTPAVPTNRDTDLHVATFNIRTMNLDSPDHPEQRWRSRADRVAALLLGAATTRNAASIPPDVIALQEANQSYAKFTARCTNQMIDLRNRLNAGGGRHYEATSLNPSSSVGTRILFDTGRLRLESAGSVLLAPVSVDHPHLAWAIFQDRDNGSRFFFGSVHLAPGEGPDVDAARNAEWDQLITDVPSLSQGLPVVLGGDFNSPRSGANGTNTAAPNHLPQMLAAGFGDTLIGKTQSPSDPETTVTGTRPVQRPVDANCKSFNAFRVFQYCEDETDPATTRIGQQIDYVFASNQLAVENWEMVLDIDAAHNWIGTIPSDHNLLRATVTLPGATG